MRPFLPNFILFLLTIFSTLLIGGVIYSLSVISILLAHEMGHYLASRRYRVSSSLPYFIPFPLPPFGTLGAIIRTRNVIPHRRALFDIGAWGPLFGLSLAIPAVVVGLLLSEVTDVSQLPANSMALGNSPMFSVLQRLVLGSLPPDTDVILHPIAYAGWVGLFITSLNLLPAGQLDGGHIIYSLFGPYSKVIFRLTLLGITLICLIYNLGWLLLVIVLLFIGYRHPPPLDDHTPLDQRRKITGIFAFCILFTTFTPIPFPNFAMGIREALQSWLNL
ncbi:MAG: site-2 protease family protein [Deltaproteobacteria bacterium]|nr:MAG: site-2 protease family protein [Deltaproteobacteria bacterium]